MGVEAVVWAAVIVIFLVIVGVSGYQTRGGRRSSIRVGPAASGTIYDFLNQDKRNAIELIVEEKAGARDPETADDIVKPPDAHH
jgi:hypothetical protein